MAGAKKNKYGLTEKQTRYAAARAAGKSQRAAYIDAGYSDNQNDTSKRINACRLEKDNPAIQKHIEYLQQIAAKHMLEDIEDRKAALLDIYLNSTNNKERLKALDLLNRMHGDYIDKKEINANITGLTRSDRLQAMEDTLETLKKAWNASNVEE